MWHKNIFWWVFIIIGLYFVYELYVKNIYSPKTRSSTPLPVNLNTNGVANGNTNDVASRINFRQQPVGGSSFS